MEDQLIVSVYCLAYNHESYIRDTLEGFINQKVDFRYEVIVHDDASTDHTVKIIEEYAIKYPNIIKPIYQKVNQYSQGINVSQMYVYPKLNGKYIAVCEGDDYWCDSNKLQLQVDFMESHPEYVACVHNSEIYNCNTKIRKPMFSSNRDYDITFDDVIEEGSACYHTSSLLYKREFLFNRPNFFDGLSFGDWPLSIYLSLNGKIRFINRYMSVYRFFSNGSWTSSTSSEQGLLNHNSMVNKMLDGVNEYTDFKYDNRIEMIKLRHEYLMYMNLKNYKRLKDRKYRGIWKKQKIKKRLYIFIKSNEFLNKLMEKCR